ncbi:MAG: hypothetical protein AAF623_18105 [Planctomycetota bacterium]
MIGRNSNQKTVAPWQDESSQQWLNSLKSWKQIRRLILGTLQLDPQQNSHEIRAAVSMVIMFCRDGFWADEPKLEMDDVIQLAARQLVAIKHAYETKGRINPELKANKKYRAFLTTLDQEIRILEARTCDPAPPMPNTPPVSWGPFWFDDFEEFKKQ